ncbi:hypothetical protein FACS189449_07870 [Alphaproteobacteria bacterium]|nr:hypothetical protein FACS189449_07870 [Alphaproteobacteria bacterium]
MVVPEDGCLTEIDSLSEPLFIELRNSETLPEDDIEDIVKSKSIPQVVRSTELVPEDPKGVGLEPNGFELSLTLDEKTSNKQRKLTTTIFFFITQPIIYNKAKLYVFCFQYAMILSGHIFLFSTNRRLGICAFKLGITSDDKIKNLLIKLVFFWYNALIVL